MSHTLLQQLVLLVLHHDGVGQGNKVVPESVVIGNVCGEKFIRARGVTLVHITDDIAVAVVLTLDFSDDMRDRITLVIACDLCLVGDVH